jgi:hypothetical protein
LLDMVDREEEGLVEKLAEDMNETSEKIQDALLDTTDYRAVYQQVARLYVKAYEAWLAEEGLNVALEFVEMTSPKFYNYETDKVYCNVELDDLVKMFSVIDPKDLDRTCREHLTSRSGFISFYDPDYTTWGFVEDWDENQLSMLFEAFYDAHDFEDKRYDVLEYAQGNGLIDDALFRGVNWGAFAERLGRIDQ